MIMGCLLFPFKFIGYLFGKFKWWVAVLILAGIGLVLTTAFNAVRPVVSPKPAATATTNVTIPTVKQAPYIVNTATRQYYTKRATTGKDGTVVMEGYWEAVGNKWTYRDNTVSMTVAVYGKVTVVKR